MRGGQDFRQRREMQVERDPTRTVPMSSLLRDQNNKAGFTLVECMIALVLLMVASLAVVSVMNFSLRSNSDARKRYGAYQIATQRSEDVRNMYFDDLAAGTTTENNVLLDGIPYRVVRTIEAYDLIAIAPGPETKRITITVSTVNNPMVADTVTVITYRAVNRPGPNRLPNSVPA